jgi:CheY-like chemotaxis protein
MRSNPSKESFLQELNTSLHYLYDPARLRASPLLSLFGVAQRADAPSALQRIINEAISALKPADGVPSTSNAWRIYHILYYRYTEQFTQHEVALDLALSTRQLRRQEKVATQVLADYLWHRFSLEAVSRLGDSGPTADERSKQPNSGTPSPEEELEWVVSTVPSEAASVRDLIRAACETAQPLFERLGTVVNLALAEDLPPVNVRMASARQALLSVLTTAAYTAGHKEIHIVAQLRNQGYVSIVVEVKADSLAPGITDPAGNLGIARELTETSGGLLEVTLEPLSVQLTMPTIRQSTVLFVDDNADTLRLYQRYLARSRYRFLGTSDPRQALKLAEATCPDIVVLDVMLPEVDGWELLGQMREHPQIGNTPIVVCSILPQREFALTLGAADFVPKPASRATILEALDRQTAHQLPESR